MNQNRPFFSTNTNFYDESFRSSGPTVLNGQNVILSQEQQRKICDTLNTSIVGNNNYGFNTSNYPENNIPVMVTQRQFFPGGATFTFTQQQPQQPQPQHFIQQPQPQPQHFIQQPQPQPQHFIQGTCCNCLAPNTVAFDTSRFYPGGVNSVCHPSQKSQIPMETQPSGLDYLNYQQQLANNPFQLKFHHDHCTSCSDLLNWFTQIPGSRGIPDLSNIAGALHQHQAFSDNCQMSKDSPVFFPLPPIEFSSNAKRLTLTKNVPPLKSHVVDVVDEIEKNEINKRKVSFSDTNPNGLAVNEKSSQMTSECVCEAKKCKNKAKKPKKIKEEKPKRKNKEKKQKEKKSDKSNATSSDTATSSGSECDSDHESAHKAKWWNKRRKKKSNSTTTSGTEEPSSEDKEKEERKRNKQRRKYLCPFSKDNCGQTTDSDRESNSTLRNCQSE